MILYSNLTIATLSWPRVNTFYCNFLYLVVKTGETELDLGARELGFFKEAGALFSDVSGAGAGAIKIFGSSSSYPIIEKM